MVFFFIYDISIHFMELIGLFSFVFNSQLDLVFGLFFVLGIIISELCSIYIYIWTLFVFP